MCETHDTCKELALSEKDGGIVLTQNDPEPKTEVIRYLDPFFKVYGTRVVNYPNWLAWQLRQWKREGVLTPLR